MKILKLFVLLAGIVFELHAGDADSVNLRTVDLTGNWRDTAAFESHIQTRERGLAKGQLHEFHQTLDLPLGEYELVLDYDPRLDHDRDLAPNGGGQYDPLTGLAIFGYDPDARSELLLALGGKLEGFCGLAVDSQMKSLDFVRLETNHIFRARCDLVVTSTKPTTLSILLHATRPLRTMLRCVQPLPNSLRYKAIAPEEGGEQIMAHGIPFLTRGVQWFRSDLQKGVDRYGLNSWKNGLDLDCAGTPVKTAYFLGMIHNIDIGNGSWYSPKGDHGYSHFVGDEAGTIIVTWNDNTETKVPLVFGFNVWFSRPWDMIWHYDAGVPAPGPNRDHELFGGSERDRDTIRNSLALVDGVRLMGADCSNARYIFALNLGGKAVKSIQVRGTPELYDYPLISAVTLELSDEVKNTAEPPKSPLADLPHLTGESPNVRAVTLEHVARAAYRSGVERIMRVFYTFVEDLPALSQPEIPEGYFGPEYNFQGHQNAVYAACYLYRNGPECASHCPDSGNGPASVTASGQLAQYMNGMGVWFRNPTDYQSITDWFASYRKAVPGQFPGINYGWPRGVAPLLREAVAFGYEKFATTHSDWLDNAMMTESTPPHWSRVAGWRHPACYEVKVGEVIEQGNRENDGHGLCMMSRYMVWHWLGRNREWNQERWQATQASAEWLQWQLDTDTIRPGKRKDVLYTESECAHGEYDIYSTWSCIHGLKLARRLAKQLGHNAEVVRWGQLYDRLRQGCLDHLVDKTDHGPVWHTYPENDWQDHAHKMMPITLSSDGDSFTPLDDYARGDSLDRKCLEISRNSYRYLMKERNYDCLRMYGYGQGYMTQAALLLDEMVDAEHFLDRLLRYCYLPKFGGWTGPEGIIVHRSGKYYLPVNGYMGHDIHVAESTKALRIVLGFDDNDPEHLRLVPRYPATWTHMAVNKFPVLTGRIRQHCRYTYDRGEAGQSFSFNLEHFVERISIRLGPIPLSKKVKTVDYNGRATNFSLQNSGDSTWLWLQNLSGKDGIISVRFQD